MSISTADLTNLIVQHVPQIFADGTNRETYLRRLIRSGPATRAGGSQWKFKDSGSTATNLAEYDPLPAADNFTQQDAILAAAYFASVIEISMETMDQIDDGSIVLGNYLDEQVMDALKGIESAVETATAGGTTGNFLGLGSWILDTGSPAGISRTTYSNWQAYTLANSSTPRPLTMALMRDAADTLRGTRQGRFTAVLMSPSKASVYRGLSGVGQAQAVFNISSGERGITPPVGVGSAIEPLQPIGLFDEVPVYSIPTCPSDKVWFVDLDAIHYEVVRAPRVSDPRPTSRRSNIWEIAVGLNLVVPNPYKNCAAIVDLS